MVLEMNLEIINLLNDDIIVLKGIMEIFTKSTEADIRKEMTKAINSKFPNVRDENIEF